MAVIEGSPVVTVGPSPRMKAVYDYLRLVAHSDSTVLITGETGTGKEVIARQIHEQSRRRAKPFVAVSCALLSETLIESELFGHERGAFTGAVGDRPGRFELANGGTVLLDDIDDVPVSMQVKLLRVLQNRTIERVGGIRTMPVNVRVIAATKKDLREMVAAKTFREDLYYRLNVLPLALPPLRERPEDILVLANAFLKHFFRQRDEDGPDVLADRIAHALCHYRWPGNVRELEHACERLAQTATPSALESGRLPPSVVCGDADGVFALLCDPLATPLPVDQEPQSTRSPREVTSSLADRSLDQQLAELEARLIAQALDATGGNKTRAAELLQIERSTLGDRIKRLSRIVPSERATGGGLRIVLPAPPCYMPGSGRNS